MSKPLYKTVIIIWSEKPTANYEITQVAQKATDGEFYCSVQNCDLISDPSLDLDWDGTDFFGDEKDEEVLERFLGISS